MQVEDGWHFYGLSRLVGTSNPCTIHVSNVYWTTLRLNRLVKRCVGQALRVILHPKQQCGHQ